MKNAEYYNVKINDGFCYKKQRLNENVTIHSVYERFCETGRVDAFNFDWKEGMENKPHYYWDSDIAKWIEGAAYIIKNKEDKALEQKIEAIIDKIEKHQEDSGYFNLYFTLCEPENRFTDRNLHELYCAGHLTEAAVAYFEATGRDRFLSCVMKYADYIEKVFIIDKSAEFTTPGHEEIELALVKLYRCTGIRKYLDMALFFINNRGINDKPIFSGCTNYYDQSHLPVREQTTAEGHAVRACYLYCAMADLAYETGDTELLEACRILFDDIVNHKMYITGGIGSTNLGEAFTIPYDLSNDKAYAETCASIGMMLFSQRMLQLENDSKYADIIEREFYNGMLSGLSTDGTAFFYENPLEINLKNYTRFRSTDDCDRYPIPQRKVVFDCSCCPPNVSRVLASFGQFVYGYDEDNTMYVNQFTASSFKHNGMEIEQETDYPNDDKLIIRCKNISTLYIRIPSWCDAFEINGEYEVKNGYACIVNPGERVEVSFNMKPLLIESNTNVGNNCGKAAVTYGPVVYCIESIDNIDNLHNIYIDKNAEYSITYNDRFGLNTITADGYIKEGSESLYSVYSEKYAEYKISLIPYSCFANRGESNMLVWLNVR